MVFKPSKNQVSRRMHKKNYKNEEYQISDINSTDDKEKDTTKISDEPMPVVSIDQLIHLIGAEPAWKYEHTIVRIVEHSSQN